MGEEHPSQDLRPGVLPLFSIYAKYNLCSKKNPKVGWMPTSVFSLAYSCTPSHLADGVLQRRHDDGWRNCQLVQTGVADYDKAFESVGICRTASNRTARKIDTLSDQLSPSRAGPRLARVVFEST